MLTGGLSLKDSDQLNEEVLQHQYTIINDLFLKGKLNESIAELIKTEDDLSLNTNFETLKNNSHFKKLKILHARILEKQGNYRKAIDISKELVNKNHLDYEDEITLNGIMVMANSYWRI